MVPGAGKTPSRGVPGRGFEAVDVRGGHDGVPLQVRGARLQVLLHLGRRRRAGEVELDVDLVHVLVPDRVGACAPRGVAREDDLVPDVVRCDRVRAVRVEDVAGGERRVLQVLNRRRRREGQRDDVVEVGRRLREREDDGVAVRRLDARHAVMPLLMNVARAAGLSAGLEFSNAVQNALKPAIVEM